MNKDTHHSNVIFITILSLSVFLSVSVSFARDSRPFWTEKSAFVEGDELFVVGIATKARTVEEGRQLAFEHGKIELMNYIQVTSLEAQGLAIETQMTFEEPNMDGSVTIYRLLRVPLDKLRATQDKVRTQTHSQEVALENARRELLALRQSVVKKNQDLEQQQQLAEQLLNKLRAQLNIQATDKNSSEGRIPIAEQYRLLGAQLDAKGQEIRNIVSKAELRLMEEQENLQGKCKDIVKGMNRSEVEAVMGLPKRVHKDISTGLVQLFYGEYTTLWIEMGPSGNFAMSVPGCSHHHRSFSF